MVNVSPQQDRSSQATGNPWQPLFDSREIPQNPADNGPMGFALDGQGEDERTQDRDRAKRVLKVALGLGISTDLVDTNLEEAEKTLQRKGLNTQTFRRSDPVYARWLAESPFHIALTRPDQNNLQDLSKLYARRDDPLRRLTDTEKDSIIDVLTAAELIRQNTAGNLAAAGLGFAVESIEELEGLESEIVRNQIATKMAQYEEFVTGVGKAGAFETPVGPAGFSGIDKLPWLGGVIGTVEVGRIWQAAKAVQSSDVTATAEQEALLLLYGRLWTAADARGQTFWAKVGDGVVNLPGFATEFATTGGAFRLGSIGTQTFIKKAFRKVLGKTAGRLARKTTGFAVGGVAQAVAQTPFFLTRDTLQRMTPGIAVTPGEQGKLKAILADEGDNFLPALAKAFGARSVETLSERSGALAGFLGNKAGVSRLKAAITKRWFARNPGRGMNAFLREVGSKTAWNGPIGEVFEEQVSKFGRFALGIDPFPEITIEDLAAEATTFMFPTGGALALRGAGVVAEAKSNRARFRSIQTVLRNLETGKESPEVVEDFLSRLTEGGENAFAYVPIQTWADAWAKIKDPSGATVDAQAMAESLGVKEADYEDAVQTKGDLQVSMPAFAIRVLMKPEGDAFVDHAKTDPLMPSVEQAEEEAKDQERVVEGQPIPIPPPLLGPPVDPAQVGLPNATEDEALQLEELSRVADRALEDVEWKSTLDSLFPEKQQKAIEEVRTEARQALMKKLSARLKIQRGRAFKAERKVIREGVVAEVNKRPEYHALAILRTGRTLAGEDVGLEGLKISRESLAEDFDIKFLPKGILAKEGEGFHPDEAADLLGYPSGAHLFRAMIDAEFTLPREIAIENRTDVIMADRIKAIEGDPVRLQEEVLAAVNRIGRSKILEADIKQLVNENPALFRRLIQRVAGPLPTVKNARKSALARISKKIFAELKPSQYQFAARQAQRRAAKAFGKGDFGEALDQKVAELHAVELARAATKARDKAKKDQKANAKLRRRSRQAVLGRAGVHFVDGVNDLLERFGYVPTSINDDQLSEEERPSRGGFKRWFTKQQGNGPVPQYDSAYFIEGYRKPWTDLPIESLNSLNDTLKTMWNLAKQERILLTQGRNNDLDKRVDEGVASMQENRIGKPKPPRPTGELTRTQQLLQTLAQGEVAVRKYSSLLQQLDGFKDGGVMMDLLGFPLNTAQETELEKIVASDKALAKLVSVYTRKERRNTMHRKIWIPEIKDSLSLWDMISVGLNIGNAGNKKALQEGYTWSDAQIEAIKSRLNAKDVRFIQAILDHFESFWPESKALSERTDGLVARKVRAEAVTWKTADGETITTRGGFYPLDYIPDPRKPHRSIEQIVDESLEGKAFRASIDHHHRKNRTGGGGRKVNLSVGVIKSSLRDIIHDQTHYEWLLDANRLLRNDKLVDEIQASIGQAGYNGLLSTVNAVAVNNRQHVRDLNRVAEWFARKTRGAVLVGSISTILKQYLGFGATIQTIGAKWTMRGITAAGIGFQRTAEAEAFILALSSFMRTRRGNQDRDMAESMNQGIGLFEGSAVGDSVKAFETWGWSLIAATQWHVDRATWLGAFQKFSAQLGLEKAGSVEERAEIETKVTRMSDQAVRDSQGSGLLGDLPAVMRARGAARLFTIFQTFMVNQLNLFEKVAIPAGKRPSIKTITQAAAGFITLYIIPQMLWDELWGRLRGDQDDEPLPLAAKVANTAIKEFAGSVPFVRELSQTSDRLFGVGSRDYRGPAGLMFLAESSTFAGQITRSREEGEITDSLIRSTVRMSGLLVPGTAQLDRMIGGYFAWRDEEGSAASLIFGRPRIR